MKTLPEQQAEAWRLAPDDVKWIAQDEDGEWYGFEVEPNSYPHHLLPDWRCPARDFPLYQDEINGWDWRDTLQSREEWEVMNNENTFTTGGMYKPKNTEWKDGLPPVGTECEICNCEQGFEWCVVRYMGPKLCVVDHKTHDDQHYHLGSVKFRPIKSEAGRMRDEQVNALVQAFNCGQGAAENAYETGCRMTRELTPEVVSKFWIDYKDPQSFAKAVADYVTGGDA